MSKKQPLNNASEIIERFGGIRPMAAKIDTPVTTVQGWKKRDVIPATRREQIMKAAAENNVDLSSFVSDAPTVQTKPSNDETVKKEQGKSFEEIVEKADPVAPQDEAHKEDNVIRAKPSTSSPSSSSSSRSEHDDDIFAAIEANNRKTLAKSVWIAVGLILVAALVVFVLLRPSMDEKADAQLRLIEEQKTELQTLKQEVDGVNKRTSFINNVMPDGAELKLQEKMNELQNQAQNIQNTVDQLADRAGQISSEISSTVLGDAGGPLTMRLEALEEKMLTLTESAGLGDVIARIKTLEGSIGGQEQLKASVQELQNLVNNVGGGQSNSLEENLDEVQNEEQGALSQTLQGVSGNDLKAAAMLITFSQLRDSLNREAPFENDLHLMEKLVSDDNVELQAAIDRLSPHANGGVLTASGLAGQFKGLAGDIVESSIKGEELSISEKAKARFNTLLQVEKEGELLNGTDTQLTVSKAQKMLDEGNIQGAIDTLQTLDGDAAQSAQPFIDQAEVSLLAERVQQMLGENILSRISSQIPNADMMGEGFEERSFTDIVPDMGDIQGLDMNEVKRTLQQTLPELGQQDVITDEESGVTILPSQPGFKGFSGGQ